MLEVTFLVVNNPILSQSNPVSGACLILPGFGISAVTGVEEPTKCHGKYCLAVEQNSLTLKLEF